MNERFSRFIPNFLRGPFGIEARGSTQMSMIHLSSEELFAALNRTMFFQGLRPVSKAQFKDHLVSSINLYTMTDNTLRISHQDYTERVERALAYLYHECWETPYDATAGGRILVRQALGELPGLSETEIKKNVEEFLSYKVHDEDLAEQIRIKTERKIKGDAAEPFPGA